MEGDRVKGGSLPQDLRQMVGPSRKETSRKETAIWPLHLTALGGVGHS